MCVMCVWRVNVLFSFSVRFDPLRTTIRAYMVSFKSTFEVPKKAAVVILVLVLVVPVVELLVRTGH
jgi:hypothetical protein